MYGFGLSELLIIGIVLAVMVGLVVGAVVFGVAMARRRQAVLGAQDLGPGHQVRNRKRVGTDGGDLRPVALDSWA